MEGSALNVSEPVGCAPDGIEQHLGRYADVRRDVFSALNTALWEDGAYLRVHRGAVDRASPFIFCMFRPAPARKS